MHAFVEPQVRRLVAETLGIDAEELTFDVSLTDELAADSLDIAELAVRLETELGITVPDPLIERIRTYGDLVQTALSLTRTRAPVKLPPEPVELSARLVSPRGQLLRAEFLTPYVVETIADDALHAGPGARLEVTLGPGTDDAQLARVREQFAWLTEHGVDLSIGRSAQRETHYPSAAA
jgi:acyl carrier protein